MLCNMLVHDTPQRRAPEPLVSARALPDPSLQAMDYGTA